MLAGSLASVLHAGVVVRMYHERWEGTGCPTALAGDAIPVPGRLVALVAAFEALEPAWPLDSALAEIRRVEATGLGPWVVRAFDALEHETLLAPLDAIGLAEGTAR